MKLKLTFLQAVGELHSRNLVHRDVKPDNVIIVGETPATRRLYLIDLETLFDLNTAPTLDVVGTSLYLMPRVERNASAAWLRSADFFAVGAMFAETLLPDVDAPSVQPDTRALQKHPSLLWHVKLTDPYALCAAIAYCLFSVVCYLHAHCGAADTIAV